MTEQTNAKRLKLDTNDLTIVTWNCNGFISRSLHNAKEVQRLRDETNADIYCFQEVRLRGSPDGQPLAKELDIVKGTLEAIFNRYQTYWSLSVNRRYSGTLTLIRKPIKPIRVAFTPESAIQVLLQHLNLTRQEAGLAASSSSTAPPKQKMMKEKKKSQQTSIRSFLSPVSPSSSSSKTKTTITTTSNATTNHHPDGRFQFFIFENFDLLQTYVPNQGMNDDSYQRRQEWDESILLFLKEYYHIGPCRTLLWCGDMNCAHKYLDGTHWQQREHDNSIYEWWTDDSACLVTSKSVKKKEETTQDPDYVGMPSFTTIERRRFSQFLQEGHLVDVWRNLHPQGVGVGTEANSTASESSTPVEGPDALVQWTLPNYTWRGHLGKEQYAAKYEGKGQRVDYFLLSSHAFHETKLQCDIMGHGTQRQGLFCGSDHCAVRLVWNSCG